MIDHVSIPVRDLQRSKAFYEKALAPLGYQVTTEVPDGVGFGLAGHDELWLAASGGGASVHLALRAMDREDVHAFHRAALEAGAKDHGAPGPRAQYSPTYYAAFVLDPDGHNLEVVCHCAEGE